jgi:hypothetical protein
MAVDRSQLSGDDVYEARLADGGRGMQRERRLHRRHAARAELSGIALSPAADSTDRPDRPAGERLRGPVLNVSGGGLCVVTQVPPAVSCPFKVLIRTRQLPPGIPTLLVVRWVQMAADGRSYQIGMEFMM